MNEFRTVYLRYGLIAAIVLTSLIALRPASSVSGTYPDRSSVPPSVVLASVPADKNSAPSELGTGADSLSEPLAAMLAAGGSLSTCGASGNLTWMTTSGSSQVIRQCTLSIPQAGWVFLSMDGSLAYLDAGYEAQFEIGIDGTGGEPDSYRWVNIYDDGSGGGNGTNKSVALSMLKPITAGLHTFNSLGKRRGGTGTVRVYDPTLTVIFIPDTNSQVRACGASEDAYWTTTSSSFEIIRQCTLSVPQDGWIFLSADGSVAYSDGEYAASFRISIDRTVFSVDRYVNIYNDGGDGTDKSVALSMLKPISAGTHSFYSLGRRAAGMGTFLVNDPTLTAIFIPASNSRVLTCGASGELDWTTTSFSSFEIIRQCTLSVPQAGRVFLSANSTVSRQDGEYEAHFTIDIDATAGDHNIDRWVNVYNDSGDGTDENVALSVLQPISAGPHTFYFLGRRTSGTGTVLLYDPTLTVIMIPEVRIYLPLVKK